MLVLAQPSAWPQWSCVLLPFVARTGISASFSGAGEESKISISPRCGSVWKMPWGGWLRGHTWGWEGCRKGEELRDGGKGEEEGRRGDGKTHSGVGLKERRELRGGCPWEEVAAL